MTRGWYTRFLLLMSFCALALYLLYPSYYFYAKATPEQRDNNQAFCQALPSWSHCAKLNLGLDLQGGVHLVLGVRVDKAIEHRIDRLADGLRQSAQKQNITVTSIERNPGEAGAASLEDLHVVGVSPDQRPALLKLVRTEYGLFDVVNSGTSADGEIVLRLSGEETASIRDGAVEQTIKSIRNRADRLGVTEPTIARRGADSVLIQLPGVKDPDRAIDIIGKTAQLEFTLLDPRSKSLLQLPKPWPAGVRKERDEAGGRGSYFLLPEAQAEALATALAPFVPKGSVLAFGPAPAGRGPQATDVLRTYLLQGRPSLTGDYLSHAQVSQNPQMAGDYSVSMTFDNEGAKLFEQLTAANIGKPMAIVLDGKVASAPNITEKIGGGSAQITMGRRGDAQQRFQEAKDLVLVLKAGALPAPVEVREKRQVGKTLGQDTVARGTTAMGVAAALVVVFMVLLYRGSGLMANFALVLNVLFMMALLAWLEATLTLPGMAGIVLTIGMAVDANVLIFERIREELRLGKSARVAVDAGYKKAFGTIFDSNVTTMIAGVVLMQYGSGPVRGFAVTLIIGLSCSLYTSIVVTRLIYDVLIHGRRTATISI